MAEFKHVKPEEFDQSAFRLIGKDWMLVAAEKEGRVNAMTAGWGGFGVMWGKNVAYAVVRPQRFTKDFVDIANTFSLTFFDESFREKLRYLGTVSGRDEDKIAKTELTVLHQNDTPYFAQARVAMLCKKLYIQDFEPACFVEPALKERWYPEEDYHTLYIAEVMDILVK